MPTFSQSDASRRRSAAPGTARPLRGLSGTPASRRLAEVFHEEFEVVVADTAQLRESGFALRHEVYCREFGFEAVRADGLERDGYDDRALHYLLGHIPSGTWAGCVRIVLADGTVPGIGLPFETAPASLLDDVAVDLAAARRGSIGEISRLTVARGFRQTDGDRPAHFHPHAVLGVALIALAAAAEAGLASAVCMMKPRLERQLRVYGIHFAQLSHVVDYRGRRALFHLSPLATCLAVEPELQGILGAIRSTIAGAEAGRLPAA